jgi:hypothetical protein
MSTRSTIGYATNSNKIYSTYCHYDGGIELTGRILYTKYSNWKDAAKISRLGSISSIEDYSTTSKTKTHPKSKTIIEPDENTFIENSKQSGAEFIYLFKNNEWFVLSLNTSKNYEFKKLSQYFSNSVISSSTLISNLERILF